MIPLALVHIRISHTGGQLADSEDLRDALVRTVQQYTETFGARVKRRHISEEQGIELMKRYAAREKLHVMIE